MSNNLKMAKVSAIIGLLKQSWSHRRISRKLGVDRETVARYSRLLLESDSNPAKVTPGSDEAFALIFGSIRSPSMSRSECQPYTETIKTKLEQELSAQRIFQDIVTEHGFTGSYSSVKRFVNRLDQKTALPFRRMERELIVSFI